MSGASALDISQISHDLGLRGCIHLLHADIKMVYRKRRISDLYTHRHTYTSTHSRTHACKQIPWRRILIQNPAVPQIKELRVSRNPTVNHHDHRSQSLIHTLTAASAQLSSFLRSILTLSTHAYVFQAS